VSRKSAAVDWPTFDAPLLRDMATAFLRRRKTIAYRAGLSCVREFTESAAGAIERLKLETGHLCLCIWADGVMWLGVSIRGVGRGAGWAFQEAFHGDVQDVSAEALVGMVEATLALPLELEPARGRQDLWAVWARLHPHKG
jgi:hypothetical protein